MKYACFALVAPIATSATIVVTFNVVLVSHWIRTHRDQRGRLRVIDLYSNKSRRAGDVFTV